MTSTPSLLGFADVQKWLQQHPIRLTEIPTEHAVSLPMPTLRWGEPAYAFFASPAERRPGQAANQGAPDRWWAFRANGGQLLIYARTAVVSFAPGQIWDTFAVPPASDSVFVLQQRVRDIQTMMDAVVPAFFAGSPGDPLVRAALAGVLGQFLAPPLLDQYRALVPDFFLWLGSGPS